MLLHTLSDLYDPGYVIKDTEHPFITPFFAGANVAFRKEVFSRVGEYDETCIYAEDKDMGIRLAKAGKTMYFQPKAVVKHRNTDSILGFIRKWFLYGKGHSYLFKKHSYNDVEVYLPSKHPSSSTYKCRFKLKNFPIKAGIFVNSFLVSQIFLVLFLSFFITGNTNLSIASLIFSILLSAYCFRGCFQKYSLLESLKLTSLAYILNTSLLIGGLAGGIKNRIFFVYGTLILRPNKYKNRSY